MKFSNIISFIFIFIFGLFETITAKAVPNDCTVVEEVINTIGNDLQKNYQSKNLSSCCDFSQIICQDFNNQTAVTEIKFNNYKNLSNQDMGKIVSQFAKLPHLTTLEMANDLIVGELPNNLSELKNLQKLDLSGNCLEDKNANTKLNIKELNLSNADSCINKNKEEKDLGDNTLLKVCSFALLILGVIIFSCAFGATACMCHDGEFEIPLCELLMVMIGFIIEIIIIGSLLFGIYKGNLTYMLVFKYGYLVLLFLSIFDFCCAEIKNIYLYVCRRLFILIIHIAYYILALNYINRYEAYLKN